MCTESEKKQCDCYWKFNLKYNFRWIVKNWQLHLHLMLTNINFKNTLHQLWWSAKEIFWDKMNKQSHSLQILLTWYDEEH